MESKGKVPINRQQNIKQNYLLTGKYALKSNAFAYNFGWICLHTNMSRVLAIRYRKKPFTVLSSRMNLTASPFQMQLPISEIAFEMVTLSN